jgi:hypothetical protein
MTFTRREVETSLIAAASLIAASGSRAAARGTRARLFEFAIAGGWHHGLDKARHTIAVGDRLVLRAEPENPHDANAVAVERSDGLMLGYVPRKANEPIARLLAEGAEVEAEVVGRLDVRRESDIPSDLAFTSFTTGDPIVRLYLCA